MKPCEFEVGDIIEMLPDKNEYLFSIKPGTVCRVLKTHFPDSVGEWCLTVQPEYSSTGARNYRASRFKLVKKGSKDMSMNTTFVFFKLRELTTKEGEIIERPNTDTMTMMEGTHREAEDRVRSLLKENPTAKFVYGRLDTMAKVDAPPVKFTKI